MQDESLQAGSGPGGQFGAFSFEYAKWQVGNQAERARSIYARVALVVSLNSVIVGVFAIAAAVVVREWTTVLQVLSYLALGCFLCSVGCAFRVLWLKRWVEAPPPGAVFELAVRLGDEVAIKWATIEANRAYDVNEQVTGRMERWSGAALLFAFLDALFATSLLLAALSG